MIYFNNEDSRPVIKEISNIKLTVFAKNYYQEKKTT